MQRSVRDELCTQAKALRGLASALVGDQNADDLVQEAALQALGARSAMRVSLRAWLGGVLRHLAGKHRRATVLRQRHESRARSSAAPVPPDRLAEHRDLLQRVTAALTALPEPYQGTLLLRFFEDLPPAAIAESTGEPLATVKSRLQRGLAMLRERLDAGGSGKDWRRAITAAFGVRAGITAATTGVLLMGTGIKLAVGGTAAILTLAGLWFLSGRDPQVSPGTNDVPVAQAQVPVSGALTNDASVIDRQQVPGTGTDDPAAPGDTVVRGRCVDEQGIPLAGCEVVLQGKARLSRSNDFAPELGRWLVAHPGFRWHDREATTGADGCYSFAINWAPLHFEVTLRRERNAPKLTSRLTTLERGETRDLGDLMLPVTCLLRLRVADAEGNPVVLPWLIVIPQGQPWRGAIEPQTYQADVCADGSYTAPILAGKYGVSVFGRTMTSGGEFVIPPATANFDTAIVVAAVAAANTITGVVVDERELPQAGIQVYGLGNEASWARTNARGEFTLFRRDDDRSPVAVELIVFHDGFMPHCSAAKVPWGSRDQRLVLRPALGAEVRVTADGRPVEDFALHLRKHPANPARYLGDDDDAAEATGDHHDGGIVRVSGLATGEHLLDVVPVRTDLAPRLALPVTLTRTGPNRIDVVLLAGTSRMLRVESAAGAPAPGTSVELIDPQGRAVTTESSASAIADWNPASGRSLRLQQGTTDARGELLLHGTRGQRFVLRLSGKGHPPMVVPDVELDASAPLVVKLPSGARLEGTLGPPDLVRGLRAACERDTGAPARPVEPPGFRLLRGSGPQEETFPRRRGLAAIVAADGTFVIDNAPAGTWQLALEPWSFDRPGRRGVAQPVATVELRDGETTRVAVELPDWLPAVVEGQLLWNGAVLAEKPASLLVRHRDSAGRLQQRFEQVRTDRDGRFSVRTRAGSAVVSMTRHQQGAWYSFWSAQQVTVASGRVTAALFEIESGSVRLRLLGSDGKPVVGVPLVLLCEGEYESGWARARTLPSDANGWIECEGETRELSVQVLPQRLLSDEAQRLLMEQAPEGSTDYLRKHRLTIGKVLPRRGETVTVELQLPPDWYR